MALVLAFKLFFRALFDKAFRQRVQPLLQPQAPAEPTPAPASAPAPAAPAPSARSDALTLLAVLQREGRLIDFLKEPIAGYDDTQVGAAVRDIHRDCAAALDRIFALIPLIDQPDGSPMEVPAGFDAARFRLSGHVSGQPPYRGRLRHPGWQASKLELPRWTGSGTSANIVAPAEVEL
jgi:hypothetical protein